jgi:response regulator RpfG family c-di-GMP phosphodiesterase
MKQQEKSGHWALDNDDEGSGGSRAQHPAPSTRPPVIIALTASAFEEDRQKVLSTGCNDFVRKPFKEEDIFSMLEKHLGIQFVYEEERKVKGEGQKVKGEEVLTSEALAALPPGLLADLEQATNRSDMQQIIMLIGEIRTHDPAVADALKLLADEFQYDEILSILSSMKK